MIDLLYYSNGHMSCMTVVIDYLQFFILVILDRTTRLKFDLVVFNIYAVDI